MASQGPLLKPETTHAYRIESTAGPVGHRSSKQPPPPRCSPQKLQPLVRKRHRRTADLDAATKAKWMQDARELLASSSLSLDMRAQKQDKVSSLRSISHPVLLLRSELVAQALQCGGASHEPQLPYEVCGVSSSSVLTDKIAPRLRRSQRTRVHVIHVKRQRQPLPIDPLVSDEMRAKLASHIEAKLHGNIWQNEIRSRLARPLSATTFCRREEQIAHPLTAPGFVSQPADRLPPAQKETPGMTSGPMYTFSIEAHEFTRRISRSYARHCFRIEILINVRRLATAIRFFRRVIIPWLVRQHRRRKAAAIRIQRRFRNHNQWRDRVFHPAIAQMVAAFIHQATVLARAQFVIARTIEACFIARKKRRLYEAERARVVFRWTAKTRVCLFVHQVWIIKWLYQQRQDNVQVMSAELELMEQSDRSRKLEFGSIFRTAAGAKLLKKELSAWRQRVNGGRSIEVLPDNAAEESPTSGQEDDSALRLRQLFRTFDLDGSGALDLDEFQLMLSYLRSVKQVIGAPKKAKKLTVSQVRRLFEDLDGDSSGHVSYEEFGAWWKQQHEADKDTSASSSFLLNGVDSLVLQSRGLMFWLFGKRQQLEKKFVKRLVQKNAMESAKLAILREQIDSEAIENHRIWRCPSCGRRFGLQRDLKDHIPCDSTTGLVVDTYTISKWIREEKLRLLD